MATRKLSGSRHHNEIAAKATAAVTTNPTAGQVGGGLFATLDTDPNYFRLGAVGDDADGVIDSNYLINAVATLRGDGTRLIRLGGTVAAKSYSECGASGTSVTATGLRPIMGQHIQAGVSGDYVDLVYGKKPPAGETISGTAVASAAAIVPTGNVFHVTGTTTITSITSTGIPAGSVITIIFDGILTFTDGSNLALAGDFVTSAGDSITLRFDGTNWVEQSRSVN